MHWGARRRSSVRRLQHVGHRLEGRRLRLPHAVHASQDGFEETWDYLDRAYTFFRNYRYVWTRPRPKPDRRGAMLFLSASLFFAPSLTSPAAFSPGRPSAPLHARAPFFHRQTPGKVGLGAQLTTADGGQIFGFDIDQFGDDGVLASAQTITSGGELLVSMETFDQNTGKITKAFAKYKGMRNSYGVDGIFAGDVAL